MNISGNLNLQEISFPSLTFLPGDLNIENNARLTNILVPNLHETFNGVLSISSNPLLVTLDLRSINCHAISIINLSKNLGLETVYLQSSQCSSLIKIDTPRTTFIYT